VGKEANQSQRPSFFQKTHRWPKAVGFLFPTVPRAGGFTSQATAMNTTDIAPPSAYLAPADCHRARREFLNALGRVYLELGLPLATAFEAALADVRAFQFNCEGQP
jgi:hypothetical protein